MKICIMGFSGSGKSTLAERLSHHYSIPVMYLDTLCWAPGWVMRSREEQAAGLEAFLSANPDDWVIDGTYSHNHFEQRMAEADQIIFLNFNRFLCLYRILKRRIMYAHRSRVSMTVGCDEKIDWDFISWSFYGSRTRKSMVKFHQVKALYPDKFVELRNPKQLKKYLKSIGCQE